jgi:hypothetical protein
MKKLIALGLLLAATSLLANEDDWFRPLGLPPKASPRRISGGEGFPPLPLPATPLRRSERKRDPSPPKVLGKVIWGESASFKYETGQSTEIADWNLCPGDVPELMKRAGGALGMPVGFEPVNLAQFDGDPAKMPVLFFSGTRSLKLDPKQAGQLRAYVLAGGMAVFDSIAGSPYYYESVRKLVAAAFPEYALRTIPLDHPLHHMLVDVHKVKYPQNVVDDTPVLDGIYIGCRVGVLISRYGLGCGWDGHEVPGIAKAAFYDVSSANKIGVNLVAYALGYANVGREEAKPELFGALDEKHPTDEFVFAQLKHEGAWNNHPGGAAALLRQLRQHTALRVSLKRIAVTPGKDDLSAYGFLYLSGLDDFVWDANAVAALKSFLARNGTLLINNGLGLGTFDRAVRRELPKLLPNAQLEPLPASHPVFSSVFPVRTAQYTPAVRSAKPNLATPYLEGIALNGDLRIIYSPYDLEAGWQGCDHPQARAFQPETAMQLGINLALYATTH